MSIKKINSKRKTFATAGAITSIAALLLNCNCLYAAELNPTVELKSAQLDVINPANISLTANTSDPLKGMLPSSLSYADMSIIDQAEVASKASVILNKVGAANRDTVLLDEATSSVIKGEVPKQGQETVGSNGTFGDSLALAVPTPTPFKTLEEQVNFLTEERPIIIDADEAVEVEATIKYKDLPTDGGKTRIITGARFPVVVCSQINSKTAKAGDPFEAKLKYDLKIGDRLIAKKGSTVNGHLNYVLKARCTMRSLLSTERFYRNSGCLGVSFDEIINDKGQHLPLVARPAQTARIVENKGEGRVLGVNHYGQVTGPWSQQLRYKAIRIGLNAALAPAGVFSFGAMPVALGLIGAANPSFAFTKPVGLNVRHRRLKGFAVGFLSGVPGSWVVEDCVIKGQEAIIKPGDEFLVEFKEEFTGEPATDASLIAGAKAKVHGQVIPESSKKKESSAK